MSHDRGCSCGREKDEYATCPFREKCIKAPVVEMQQRELTSSTVVMPDIYDCGCSKHKVQLGLCTIYDKDGTARGMSGDKGHFAILDDVDTPRRFFPVKEPTVVLVVGAGRATSLSLRGVVLRKPDGGPFLNLPMTVPLCPYCSKTLHKSNEATACCVTAQIAGLRYEPSPK